MPIHIQHGNGKGHFLFLKLVQKRRVALLGVFPISAPPVTKGITGHHRRCARKAIEIADGAHIVVLIAEEIHVTVPFSARLQPSLLIEEKRFAVVKEASSAGILQAEIQRIFPVDLVQRSGGSQKIVMSWRIAVGGSAVFPATAVVGVAVLGVDIKILGSKFLFVVDQVECHRGDLKSFLLVHHVEFGRCERTVEHHLRGTVLEHPVLTVFQAQKIRCQYRKAVMLSLDHTRLVAGAVSQIFGLLTVKVLHSVILLSLFRKSVVLSISLYHKENQKSIKNRRKTAKKI